MAVTWTPSDLSPAVPALSSGSTRAAVKLLTASGTYSGGVAGEVAVTAASVGLSKIRFAALDLVTPVAGATAVSAFTAVPQADGSVKIKVNTATAEAGALVLTNTVLQGTFYGDA